MAHNAPSNIHKLTVFFLFFMSVDPPGLSLSSTGKHNVFCPALIYVVLYTDDKMLRAVGLVRLFSCQTPLCLP